MSVQVQVQGLSELKAAINALPGRVVLKIMNDWTLRQAKEVAKLARMGAPRRSQAERGNRTRQSQLWRTIKASAVRRGLKKFPKDTISRSIAYGAKPKRGGRTDGTPTNLFAWNVNGTVPRTQYSTGRYTGVMPSNAFWKRAVDQVTSRAMSDVSGTLRQSYDRAIQQEVNRIVRRYG